MTSYERLKRSASDSGFQFESLEKAYLLLRILNELRAHPFLDGRIALKGGTALNLFILKLPRLSVDIDLNYIGASDRDAMIAERPRIEQALTQVFSRLGLAVKRVPSEHAGGKWRLSYPTSLGSSGTIETDLNFMLRTPLWPTLRRDSHPIGDYSASGITVLSEVELTAGKLAALCSRGASRDIFDARELLSSGNLNSDDLRIGFVVYGGINRKDWRTVKIEDVDTDPTEVRRNLVPMLRADIRPLKEEIETWTNSLVTECRELMSAVLPLASNELEFIERLNENGEIAPELITEDDRLIEIIKSHPGLLWKALNVKKHKGL